MNDNNLTFSFSFC